ncbi:hypothetical protein [Streptomyces sp. NPDC059076]|uniref:hypothetical protein n=1 Tax=unclassified Streptomyces TaxID=2593676 RepID=UPI00367C7B27
MTNGRHAARSVRQLAAVVDGMAGRVSAERLRQLRMVVGMFDRAVGRPELPAASARSVDRLFTRPALAGFWRLAADGELRYREQDLGRPLPLASLRIVRDCLSIVAREVLPVEAVVVLPSVPQQEPKATVSGRSLLALYRGLVDLASAGPLERDGTALSYEDRTRLLAMVSIVLDSGARSGELAAQRLIDLAPGEVAVGVRRRQQKAGPNRAEEIAALAEVHPDTVRAILHGHLHQRSAAMQRRVLAAIDELEPLPEVEWHALREGSRVAVRRWLKVREGLVEQVPLEGARTALWVTLVPSTLGPSGLPIRAHGLRRAYTRGIAALNVLMAGEYGWEPMPTRMEQLRRSVATSPIQPPVPG